MQVGEEIRVPYWDDKHASSIRSALCIFARCCFRVAELSQGYHGPLLKKQGLFIGLEGVYVGYLLSFHVTMLISVSSRLIVLAVVFLHLGHPGFGLAHVSSRVKGGEKNGDASSSERSESA